jgi:uncharacterized UBP type Zn finger protein
VQRKVGWEGKPKTHPKPGHGAPSTGKLEDKMLQCTHVNQIKITGTDKHVCEDCAKTGDTWVHLRMCLECGHVGCCDSSKNRHATKHFHRTKHPLMRSIEPGEAWVWCYVDELEAGELGHKGFVPS